MGAAEQITARLGDMPYSEWGAVLLLSLQGTFPTVALARTLRLDSATLVRAIDRLEACGLVRRERSTTDRRVVHLALTAEGKALAKRIREVAKTVQRDFMNGFSADEEQQLQGFLQRMAANGEALKAAIAESRNGTTSA
jgi:DNA-binding MarR family transcriptional regulator